LIAAERSECDDGETVVDGFQCSTVREFSHQFGAIPAEYCFEGSPNPRVLMHRTVVYIDPARLLLGLELHFSGAFSSTRDNLLIDCNVYFDAKLL
jgi:hypothetical protein